MLIDINEYLKMLNQKDAIVLDNAINVDEKNVIYPFEFDGVTRYYIKFQSLMVNNFGLKKSGAVKTKKFRRKIFFPNMIVAKTTDPKDRPCLYLEISQDAFNKSNYYQLENCYSLLNKLTSAIGADNGKELADANETDTETTSEVVTVSGNLPVNYSDLIDSLNLKEYYGKLSVDIENMIKGVLLGAQYKFKVPVKVVSEPVKKDIPKDYVQAYHTLQTIQKMIEDCSIKTEDSQVENEVEDEKVNVTDYLTQESLHNFKENVLGALITLINNERQRQGLTQIPASFIRTSIHYRSAYMEYGMKYKDIENDDRYNTDEDYLMTKFFLEHIYDTKEAYHYDGEITIPFLRRDDDNTTYALLKGSRYNGLLRGQLCTTLFKQLFSEHPNYMITENDWKNIVNFITNSLYRPQP